MMRHMSRPIVIAANWKMNTTPADAGELARTIASRTREAGVTRVICPPFVSLAAVRDALAGEDVGVGAQNVHHELAGAYTGEISVPMLAGLATWVILGHSERRAYFGETDALVGKKLDRAVAGGLRPIVCVGEVLADREAGRQDAVVDAQLKGALEGRDPAALVAAGIVIAYEPVWAIGTGRVATTEQAEEAHAFIRQYLHYQLGEVAKKARILYGGSVKPSNIAGLMAQPDVDGVLVGGASLKAEEFLSIIRYSEASAL